MALGTTVGSGRRTRRRPRRDASCGRMLFVHKGFGAGRGLSVGRSRVTGMSMSAVAVEAVPPAGVDVRAVVADIERALSGASGASWAGLVGREVLDVVDRIGRLGSQLSGLR